jgi:DNA (cytosine-5)-methyltransferase 1
MTCLSGQFVRVLDLFSGIGGFSLGLERAGMRTVAFCEIEPYARAVLARHWPGVPIFGDIRALTADAIRDALRQQPWWGHGESGTGETEPGYIDVICGGFPCQDISVAGKGAGLAGERSGLWSEYARLIGEIGPRYVIVENVSALLSRGLGTVLGDLASIGYDAEWHCIPAAHVGAPHRRDRIWIVAYPARLQPGRSEQRAERERTRESCESANGTDAEVAERRWADGANDARRRDTEVGRLGVGRDRGEHWLVEPDVGRVAHGIPKRVDRLRCLGNAVVPQIPEIIGRAIMNQCSARAKEAQP